MAQVDFENNIRCSSYIILNMAEKGYVCTFRLGYLAILTYRKNVDNRFVSRTIKSFGFT